MTLHTAKRLQLTVPLLGLCLATLFHAGNVAAQSAQLSVGTAKTGMLGAPAVGGADLSALPGVSALSGAPMAPLPGTGNAAGSSARAVNLQGAQGFSEVGQGTGPGQTPAPADLAPPAPNQFQRFVQQATGQELPLYGFNLFGGQRYQPLANVPAPAHYVLGPGDDVDLKIWGMTDFAARLTVDRNGQITIPRVGTVTVAGTRADQLEKLLKTQVARVFNNFELSATLGRLRSIQVYVVGQARKPGAYTVSGLSTLISVLFESGGPAATGSMRKVQLVRNGQTLSTLDLYQFIHSGKTTGDAPLMTGDVIVIPPAGPRVAVTGALDTPAIYELASANESLQSLLAYTGGLQVLASPHKALIERINPTSATAPRQVQEVALDAAGMAQPLRDGDVLWLFPISPQFANAVTLRGNVAEPLRYSHKPGMRVADLIPEPAALIDKDYFKRKNILVQYDTEASKARVNADRVITNFKNLLDEINWEYAAIERLDARQVKMVLIPFHLGKAIKDRDPAHNLELQPGDVVTVFGVKDIPVSTEKRSRFVRLSGEFKAPGIYEARPGETLPQLIERVGGLTAQAYLYGTHFTRESVRKQQQQNLDQLVRRLESQLQSAGANGAVNLTGERAAQAASIQQAQQAQMQAQLNKLRSMQSQGRVALELDPTSTMLGEQALAQLPGLPLEDGDGVHIPALPAFVVALGSVNNENVIIHRPGKTVGDILQAAGPTEDAELSEAFLLRADGSIVSRRNRSWFSLGSFESTRVMPGDTLVVPAMIDRESRYNFLVRALRDWTQIFSNLGIGAMAIKTLRN